MTSTRKNLRKFVGEQNACKSCDIDGRRGRGGEGRGGEARRGPREEGRRNHDDGVVT